MNSVIMSRIAELSERKSRTYRLRKYLSDWKHVVWISLLAFTVKIALEQLATLRL